MTTTVELAPKQVAMKRRWTPRTFGVAWASQIGITTAFVLAWLIFTILAPDTFLHSRIYVSYAISVPYFGLVALALTMLIVAGDIDLSFPSIFALGMVGYVGVEHTTHSVTLGVLATLAIGAAAGFVNGFFVTVIGIPALVVTIGTQFFYRGLTLVLVNGKSYTLLETTDSIAGRLLVGRWFGVPMQFVWFVILARDEQLCDRQLLPQPRRRLPAAGAGRRLRGRHVGLRRAGNRVGDVRRGVPDRRH